MREGLTVAVPCYNKSGYLEGCIASIMSQTRRPEAVIIVDDCSTDDSRQVIDRLTKKYPDVHAHYKSENKGVSAARNTALSLADTEYITFIDADDEYCNKDKLALEMDLQKEKGGDIIAYSVTNVIGPDGASKTKKKPKDYYLSGKVRDDLIITRKWDSAMRDYVVKTETLRNAGGYNEAHSLYEDYELLLVLARDHEFYCTGEFGTAYREGAGLSSADMKMQQEAQEEIVKAELQQYAPGRRRIVAFRRKLMLLKRRIRSII